MRHLELAALDVYDGGRVVYVVGALASELEWQLGRANHVMRDGRGWWRMGVKNERERIRAKSEEGKSQRVHVNQHNNPASRISGPHTRHIAPPRDFALSPSSRHSVLQQSCPGCRCLSTTGDLPQAASDDIASDKVGC